MTNKYSKLSDSEVEHLIAEAISGEKTPTGIQRNGDAFNLLIDNKINLAFNPLINQWVAEVHAKHDVMTFNNNPCRAIAECFLLMKNAEVNHG